MEEIKPAVKPPDMVEVISWANGLVDGFIAQLHEKFKNHGGAQTLALWVVTSRALGSSYISMLKGRNQASADDSLGKIAKMTTDLLNGNGTPGTITIARTESAFLTWTIYEKPKDYPEHFVVRKFSVYPGNPVPIPAAEPVLAPSLEEARKFVPEGHTRIPRDQKDDPVIVETWV